MRPRKHWIAAAVALAGAMTLSGCGLISGSSAGADPAGSGSSPSASSMSGDSMMSTPTPAASTMSTTGGGMMEVKHTKAGLILANPRSEEHTSELQSLV